MKKRAIRKIARRIAATGGAALFMGAVIAPTITPTITMAAETQGLTEAIEEAKNIRGLDITVEKETITVKKAEENAKRAEIEVLEKEEEDKVRAAIDEQKRKNEEYESKANDPNYLIQGKPADYSKQSIIDFLSEDGEFNFSNVNILRNRQPSSVLPKLVGFDEKPEDVEDKDGTTGNFIIKEGAYAYYSNFLKDKATGKEVDMKVTIAEIPENSLPDRYIYFSANHIDIWRKIEGGSQQGIPIKFKVEFFEAGTDTPINIDFLWYVQDIDKYETYARNSGTYLLADAIDEPVTLTNGTTVTNTDIRIIDKEFFGETWKTAEASIDDNDDLINGNRAGNRNYEKYITLERDVNSFEFLWGGAGLDFSALDLKLIEPELETTSVSVKEYKLIVEPNDEKAVFHFVDTEGNTVSEDITKTGVDNEAFEVYDVNDVMTDLQNNGYEIVTDPVTDQEFVYDEDPKTDQEYTIVVKPIIETITPDNPKNAGDPTTSENVTYPEGLSEDDLKKTYTRTIYYKYTDENGEDVFEPVVQTATITRTATFNYATGEIEYSDWSTATFPEVRTSEKENYTYDRSTIPSVGATDNFVEYVIYNKIPQKGSVTFTDGTQELADKVNLEGYSAESVNYSPNETIKTIENKGYDIVSNNFPEEAIFDTDETIDQDYVIVFKPHTETITPDNPKKEGSTTDRSEVKYPAGVDEANLNKTIKRTITYVDEAGNKIAEPVVQEVKLTRTATFNYATGEVVYSDWTTSDMEEVVSPEIKDYTSDKATVSKITVTSDMNDISETVVYKKVQQKGSVTYKDGDKELDKDTFSGGNNENVNYNPESKITEFKNKGYDLVDNNFPKNAKYDTDTSKDQDYIVNLIPHVETITPDNPKNEGDKTDREDVVYPKGLSEADLTKTVKRTIKYVYEDGSEASKPVIQEVKLTRTATFNYITGEIVYSDWTTSNVEAVESPSIANYTPDKATINSAKLNATDGDLEEIVTYKAETITGPYDTSIDDPIYTQTYNEDYTDNVTDEPTIPSNITQDTTVASDTGDKSNIGLFAGIAAGALAGIGAMVAKIRKREE